MNTIFRKATLAMVALTVIAISTFAPVPTYAATSFNGDQADYPTIQVSNRSRYPDCTGCWRTSVNADAGEIVSFILSYHNSGSDTARNVKVRATLPAAAGTNFSVPGTVWADNASAVTHYATVNLTSSQTLTLIPGSVKWYPNRGTSPYPFIYGQNGSEVTGAGLNVGDLLSGWSMQGYVVFRAQVSSNTASGNTGGGNQQNIAPAIISQSGTANGTSAASLNANVSAGSGNANVWFEYGTTQALGNATNVSAVNANNSQYVYATLSNLNPNTTYYFRTVASSQFGTVQGSIATFVTDSSGSANNQQNQNAPVAITQSASGFGDTHITLNSIVNPNGAFTNYWFEYGTTPSLGSTTGTRSLVGSGNANVNEYISGLNQNTTYYFRIVASNSAGITQGSVLSFTTTGTGGSSNQGQNISVYNAYASGIGQSFAQLFATVNSNDANTTIWFEYGTTAAFGQQSGFQSIGASSQPRDISTALSNLNSNTTYYFRAIARNSANVNYYSNTGTFTTAFQQTNTTTNPTTGQPLVTTGNATFVFHNFASLNGSVNPNGAQTDAWFEWGQTASLGNTAPIQAISSNSGQRPISFVIANLSPSTTYYFRAVARNAYGTSNGAILSFATPATTQNSTGSVADSTTGGATAVTTATQMNLTSMLAETVRNPGDEVVYKVLYKNNGTGTVRNAVLSVALPVEIEFLDASSVPDSLENNNSIIRFNLGTVSGDSENNIVLRGRVKREAGEDKEVTLVSTLRYNRTNGIQETIKSEIKLKIEYANLGLASLIEGLKAAGPYLYPAIIVILIGALVYTLRKPALKANI